MSRRKIKRRNKMTNNSFQNTDQFYSNFQDAFESASFTRFDDDEYSQMITYIDSHKYLSDHYVFDNSSACLKMINAAATILLKESLDEIECLSAIVLLGHSPCQQAIDALTLFSKKGHKHSHTARFALEECMTFFIVAYPKTNTSTQCM